MNYDMEYNKYRQAGTNRSTYQIYSGPGVKHVVADCWSWTDSVMWRTHMVSTIADWAFKKIFEALWPNGQVNNNE